MKSSVRKLPLVAMLLALTVFAGKAAVQAFSTASNTMWLYDPDRGAPTDAGAYLQAPAGAENDCQGFSEVCIVTAPDAGGQPDLSDESLFQALEQGSEHDDIIRGTYSGN
jgi:hypothetical protein